MRAVKTGAVPRLYDAVNAALFATAGGSGRVRQRLVDTVGVCEGDRVLELGCGTGQVTERLVRAGADVVAVDRLPEMMAGARRRAPQATFIVGDVVDSATGDGFDHAVVSFVLHNFDGPGRARVLRSAAERLREGGTIGVLDWALPAGRRRARLWRRFVVALEPSGTAAQVVDGELEHDIAAAGLRVAERRPVAGGRAQCLILARGTS
jgi:ubiquinone/menaquinone biosynthesis C-methylase UbiE